jgi:hypothetical protein
MALVEKTPAMSELTAYPEFLEAERAGLDGRPTDALSIWRS